MPKITSVEPQKRNPHRFNIFLDGEFAFGVDEDSVVDFRLVSGKIIDSKDLDKILFGAEVGKLMERLYGLLGVRIRSEKEIRDYLKNTNFKRKLKNKEPLTNFVMDSAVERLKQKGLIDDFEFAKLWAQSRLKKRGVILVKQELFGKGISKEIIDEVLGQGNKYQEDVALALLEKRVTRYKNLTETEKRKKAFEFLVRRGFEFEVARSAVEKFLKKGYDSD